jgi:hypothetical protein
MVRNQNATVLSAWKLLAETGSPYGSRRFPANAPAKSVELNPHNSAFSHAIIDPFFP